MQPTHDGRLDFCNGYAFYLFEGKNADPALADFPSFTILFCDGLEKHFSIKKMFLQIGGKHCEIKELCKMLRKVAIVLVNVISSCLFAFFLLIKLGVFISNK
ncbi:hypothetical protein SRA_04001 [Streptococcus ratti FA-1 = DSM 20564]|uniref:Uncharacterized protein n=1 Tax=Streptococcus ratti FA-1 = DSM 20564 TaxID=699248 RepID=A0ABN0GTG4_STRRT|nr:hypothetical protein SRA_04001 [Streptococcus ratti FA-1 = DSM 20564]